MTMPLRMPLADLQFRFQDFLLNGGDDPQDPLPGLVSGTSKAGAGELMAVYFNAYRLRLMEVLGEDFKALKVFLGEDGFETLALAYIDQHPSRHPSIRWFGQRLPLCLATHPPYRDEPVLRDLAAWEWALGEAFDAADADPVTFEQVAAVPPDAWDGLGFTFQPALRRLDLEWNVPAYRAAVEDGAGAPEAPAPSGAPVPWLIWRRGLDTLYRSMEADEARALDLVRAGAGFGALCADLAQTMDPEQAPEQAPGRAATFLRTWIDDGLVCGLSADG
ncbi:MAG: putative DNA-binding domain-containing protein [Hyphomicrobiales bacterium]|nr:putative DNA-binding domain-containing protein [Hyphomicrobiales bacterium]